MVSVHGMSGQSSPETVDEVALQQCLVALEAQNAGLTSEIARLREGGSRPNRFARMVSPAGRMGKRLWRSIRKRVLRRSMHAIALDANYSLREAEWDKFLARRAGRLSAPGGAFSTSARLWIVFTTDDRNGASDFGRSVSAIEALAAHAFFEIRCVAVGWSPDGVTDLPVLENATIGEALNRANPDDLVAFLRPGDVLRPEFVAAAAATSLFSKKIVLLDGVIRGRGRVWPVLHPGINYIHALNCDYFRSRLLVLAAAARDAVAKGELSPRAIALDVMAGIHAGEGGEALHLDVPVLELAEDVSCIAAERTSLVRSGGLPLYPSGQTTAMSESDAVDAAAGPVTIIICTRDRGLLLRQLVRHLLQKPPELIERIIIVRHGTTNAHALRTHDELARAEKVMFIDYEGEFNFSAQCNLASLHAKGKYLLFLNDDLVPVTDNWLDALFAPFVDPAVAITGPLLIYPDERVQQAGMYLGYRGIAGHGLRFARLPEQDFMFFASAPRYVSAVTGAVMLVERGYFESSGGFDIGFAKTLQDVEFCTRAIDAGRRVVYTPPSVLIHMESVSARETYGEDATAYAREREIAMFRHVQASRGLDPFHNVNLDPGDEAMRRLRLLWP